ncbi:putative mitochondrial paraflagellar rod component, putative (PFC19) [Leptomonas pyrrhocoris]|uniref:Putative mitochondrial paraflagellar rod component, putative (PFC19) n=1 Tax=Leptomonas pyrrhocoris TaxID=157538 RepID=A0A0M9G3K7_LEPPY|nr:putative mitochondrial paraflagellar rod component, putative (PFC19) [Leptomonas pyrrhocoris]XP_015659983.1 putative mitochondrial paraflagellar rod component, putative (PFC19) [Leptomonas pyrrhocoris]KPA81543.1 putative mitochondrial paraflagellar rod component, putative (PFC19) [Leptomonas pyrrhocoris]KPA81544.1 putative mitochondrial paraflagellar rod component, putative (PFC19) [Leptomonas pyrrhocoris]|eukprot:XP_015659982.1 putative mitochondrial paraflagellar rod component, putative (PFC19) [Leptomonas pyrrhocoris]
MDGRLFTIARDGLRCTSLFVAGDAHRCILVVGSQMDALLATPYAHDLFDGLKESWAVAQVELGSSRVDFGVCDHMSDADDVNAALHALTTECKMTEVVLYGSGTGVQVVLEVLASGSQAEVVTRVVLHGGVVSPESSKHFAPDATEHRVSRAQALLKENRGADMGAMKDLYDIPVTPARLRYGNTLTVQEALWQPVLEQNEKAYKAALRGIAVPALFLLATDASYNARAASALPAVRSVAMKAIGLSSEAVHVELLPNTVDEHRRVLKGGGPLVVTAVQQFLASADMRREQRRIAAEANAVEAERQHRFDLAKAMYA